MKFIADYGTFAVLPLGSNFLRHYLNNTGENYILNDFTMSRIVNESSSGRVNFEKIIDEAFGYAKTRLREGEKITFSSKEDPKYVDNGNSDASSYHFKALNKVELWMSTDDSGFEKFSKLFSAGKNKDLFLSFGDANAAITCSVELNNGKYTMSGNYIIFDMYAWRPNFDGSVLPGVIPSDNQFFDMHSMGIAKQFYVWGERSFTRTFY